MLKIARLAPELSVSPQPSADDFAAIKAQGFASVINNRTEGEDGNHPGPAEEKAIAESHGLAYAHLPVRGAELTEPGKAEEFARLIESLPKPILAHCGGGTRSAVLWALANAGAKSGAKSAADILATTAAAGYDLTKFKDAIEQRAAARGKP